ncbi:MAG: hypothetical protein ACR652_17555 [Methylocystis sp.]|uniref:hypothetical protein n=1 Tax=Methylocystis sp. TaxID=1911079 RepID=UPI003DA1DF8F
MNARLTLDVAPCTALSVACEEAQRLADLARENVAFDFNGVVCIAEPDGSADHLAHQQSLAQRVTLSCSSSSQMVEMIVPEGDAR